VSTISTSVDAPRQRQSLIGPKLVRKAGVVLYALSFLMPPHWSFEDFQIGGGLAAFVETPIYALICATRGIDENNWHLRLLAFVLVVGWVLFIGVTFLGSDVGLSSVAAKFVPFYPWALGVALIHLSRLAEPKPAEERRTIWTGF